jgi:ATP-dependent DNA helicase RecQ
VIARRWKDLTALAALCRQRNIPVELVRDAVSIRLYETREGFAFLSLLRGEQRHTRKRRVTLRSGALGRWFRRRFGVDAKAWIAHPARAALAQFITEREAIAPGYEQVADDLIDALYEFDAGPRAPDLPNAPMPLLAAHRAKGLEFNHVLILDGGGWTSADDDERRLYYVAMTRARETLTLCETVGGRHPFVRDTGDLPLRTRPRPTANAETRTHPPRVRVCSPKEIVLSWPGYFAPEAPIHRAIAALEVGDALTLQPESEDKSGWALADASGTPVGRMSSHFQPPKGKIVAVRVAAILVRRARADEKARVPQWELVLPEIDWTPESLRRLS